MVKKLYLALIAFIGVLFLSSSASALVDIEGRYWFSNLDAKAKVSSGSVIGTDIDLVNTLGIDDKKNFFDGRLSLEWGNSRLRYGFIPLKWDGSQRLSQSVTFAGKTYTVATSVDTKLKIDYHRLGYEYDFINFLDNHLGVILEAKYFNGDVSLKDPSLGLDEKHSFKVPLPTVGISAQAGLPFLFNVGGEVTGITIGSKAYMVDGEAAVNFKPIPFFVASAGYRYFKIHLKDTNDRGDATLKGPFLMLKANF